MDCGLISKKPRGLNAKCPKLDFPGIVFLKETHGPSPRVRGPPGLRSTVDWPPSPIGGVHRSSAYGRPSPRKLTATAREGRGAHQGSVQGLTRGGGATWRPGDCGAESAVVALGESDAQAWREEKSGGERCGEARWWCSPFIGAGGCSGCNCR
jgi:hypothetical protein